MFFRFLRALPVLFLLLAAGPAAAQAAKDAKADANALPKVNGKTIPKSRFDFVMKQRAAQGGQDPAQLRQMVMDGLITQAVVAQEAERKGLAKNPEVQTQVELAREQILIQAYMQDYIKAHPVKDEQLLAEYNKVKASRGDKEYKVRHILVDKDTEAKDIIAQLKKGAKFEDLASKSKDPGSRERGGDLDWNSPSTFVKPFAEAMVKLDKGQLTDTPVQSQFGWHVIRLDDVRAAQFPAFDTVKPQILQMLQQQEVQKLVSELRAKAKIE